MNLFFFIKNKVYVNRLRKINVLVSILYAKYNIYLGAITRLNESKNITMTHLELMLTISGMIHDILMEKKSVKSKKKISKFDNINN